MNKFKTLSIVIPSYNEEQYIEEIVRSVIRANSLGLKKEIVIVDDASHDKTPAILKKLQKSRPFLKIVFHKTNRGKGHALKTGFGMTTGDIVLIQDADLEYNPSDYPSLLEPFLYSEADVVYGSRLSSAKPHRVLYFWHYIVNKSLTLFSNMLTNLNLTDMETGYKVFKGNIIRKITPTLQSNRFGFEPEITAKISKVKNIKIFEVGISYSGRTYGEGKKIGWKDGAKAVWEIIKFNLLDPS